MAAIDNSAEMNYPAQENLDQESTGDNFAMAIEKFDSTVHMTVQKDSIMDGVFTRKPLVGTDTMSNPTLAAVVAGVAPVGTTIEVGKMIVQVKTPIIARVREPMLATVQDHLDIKSRTPANFGRKIAKHEDMVFLNQCLKSVIYEHAMQVPIHPTTTGATVTGKGTGGILIRGTQITLTSASDEADADKMDAAITTLHQTLAEEDLDPMSEGFLYVAPAQWFTMLKSDKLISADYSSGNGNYAGAMIQKVSGLPLKMTNRLSQSTDIIGSLRASDSIVDLYGSAYETTAEEAKHVALYATSDTIMVAQAIPLTTKVWWDDNTLM